MSRSLHAPAMHQEPDGQLTLATSRTRRWPYTAAVALSLAAAIATTSAAAAPQSTAGKLVFSTGGDESDRLEIAVISPDGSDFKKLTHHAVAGFGPTWTTDGRQLLFLTEDSFTERSSAWRMRLDGSRIKRLPAGVPSPSGRQIARLTSKGIGIVAANGKVLRRLRLPLNRRNDYFDVEPLWSPDERYIAVSIGTETARTDYERVFVVRTDRQAVGRSITKQRAEYYEYPIAWSPAGHRLLISAHSEDSRAATAYLVTPDGRQRRRVRSDFLRGFDFALSHDGSRIAYVSKAGTILVAPLRGGRARLLARPRGGRKTASSVDVSWSHDGRRIAYSDEDGIHVIAPDGSGRRLVTRRGQWKAPAWSPDGTRIAFSVDRDKIYVVGARGRGLKRLTKSIWDDSPQWSRDGSRVAFLRGPDSFYDPRTLSVFVMDAHGAGQRRLGRGYGPRWNPDGRRVAFVDVADSADPPGMGKLRTGRIVVADASGSGQSVIASGTAPDWSPDGTQLAFMHYVFGLRESDSDELITVAVQSTLYVVGTDGANLRKIIETDWDAEERTLYKPTWSPDGRTIALRARSNDSEYPSGVALVDVDTPNRWRLLEVSGIYDFAWSPDGSQIAYTNYEGLHTIRPDGSEGRVVSKLSIDADPSPSWSPDGTLLGFVGCLERRHSDDTTCDLYVVRPDGSGQKRLTRTPGGEGALDWWAPAGSG